MYGIFACGHRAKAIEAVMIVCRGTGRYSAQLLKDAVLTFYTDQKLLPAGLDRSMACVDLWALKQASALQRLVSCLSEVDLLSLTFSLKFSDSFQ